MPVSADFPGKPTYKRRSAAACTSFRLKRTTKASCDRHAYHTSSYRLGIAGDSTKSSSVRSTYQPVNRSIKEQAAGTTTKRPPFRLSELLHRRDEVSRPTAAKTPKCSRKL